MAPKLFSIGKLDRFVEAFSDVKGIMCVDLHFEKVCLMVAINIWKYYVPNVYIVMGEMPVCS